jgi:hypothetical protein
MNNGFERHQGDVGFERVDEVRGKRIKNRPIALGEVTGHSHRVVDIPPDMNLDLTDTRYGTNVLVLDGKPENQKADERLMKQQISETVEMYEDEKGTLTLRTKNRVAIVHEEHMTQVLDPGVYEYVPQVEHDPWEGLRNVVD